MITKYADVLKLNEKHFYVDAMLQEDSPKHYCFKSLHTAIAHSQSGTKEEPMMIYLAPNVYQMKGTTEDRGLYIYQDWVSLIGLSKNAEDVILADNRGHMVGAEGESGSSPAETLFITGTGFHAENLTIGNYCNIDLIYPMNPSKNQKKRSETITQAYCIGAENREKVLDYFYFKNVYFMSMLDTIALGNVQRVYYEKCYIQGTDDFMGGGRIHVMKDTTLRCFSGKPIYTAGSEGMAFINCTWEIEFLEPTTLNLSKHASTLYLIGCHFKDLTGNLKEIHWTTYPQNHIKCYEYQTTLDGVPYSISQGQEGIILSEDQVKGYTVCNLLQSREVWELIGVEKSEVVTLPLNIKIDRSVEVHMDEQAKAQIKVSIYPKTASQKLKWTHELERHLSVWQEGGYIKIIGYNPKSNRVVQFPLRVVAENSIYNECLLTLYPPLAEAPIFARKPYLLENMQDTIKIDYELELDYIDGRYEDKSIINWYRCYTKEGADALLVATSKIGEVLKEYTLTSGDVGYYIMAEMIPKHERSQLGESIKVCTDRRVTFEDLRGVGIEKYAYESDFHKFPTARQPLLIPGTWTVDSYYPLHEKLVWKPAEGESWTYGEGVDGAFGEYGLLTIGRGARLLWTQEKSFNEMSVNMVLNTEKTAAQGFGSATGQYLEIYIKYDTATLSGYALRIERTMKYGFATDFTLYEYTNGAGLPISETISSTAFNSKCYIRLWTMGNYLYTEVESTHKQSKQQREAGLIELVALKAEIQPNSCGGMGILHTGTVSVGNRIQLVSLAIRYR